MYVNNENDCHAVMFDSGNYNVYAKSTKFSITNYFVSVNSTFCNLSQVLSIPVKHRIGF